MSRTFHFWTPHKIRMYSFILINVLLCGSIYTLCAEETPDPLPRTKAEELIRLLRDGDFDERSDAELSLKARGAQVITELTEALQKASRLEFQESLKKLLAAQDLATLQLEITDYQGQPIKELEAKITYTRLQPDQPRNRSNSKKETHVSDDAGVIKVTALRPGTYRIYFSPQGHRTSKSSYLHNVLCLSGTNRFRILVPADVTISGSIISALTKKPLEDAAVTLIPAEGVSGRKLRAIDFENRSDFEQTFGRTLTTANTDKKGIFQIKAVGRSEVRVLIRCEGHKLYLSDVIKVNEQNTFHFKETLVLQPRNDNTLGHVSIHILDTQGKPVSEADVDLQLLRTHNEVKRETMKKKILDGYSIQKLFYKKTFNNISTDKKGMLKTIDLEPGTYFITLKVGKGEAPIYRQITVVAGKNIQLTLKNVTKTGGLSGKIVASNQTPYIESFALPVQHPLITYLPEIRQRSDYQYIISLFNQENEESDFSIDNFTINNLGPGTYIVFLLIHPFGSAIVYDVKVDKEITKIKVITIKGSERRALTTSKGDTVKEIKIVAQFLDGTAAKGARISLQHRNGSHSSRIGSSGTYTFNVEGESYIPTRVSLTMAGYRPLTVDLTTGTHDFNNIRMVLKEMQYGKLRITAKTPSGQIIPGVLVWPERNQKNRSRRNVPQTGGRNTNAKGQATFKGLATGLRRVYAHKSGYFKIEDSQEVDIKAKVESNCSITLSRGYSLTGKIVAPHQGPLPVNAQLVYLRYDHFNDPVKQMAVTNAQGQFEFTGLKPGTVLLTPFIPGFLPREVIAVELKNKDVSGIVLEPVRPSGLDLEVGPYGKGYSATLQTPDGKQRRPFDRFFGPFGRNFAYMEGSKGEGRFKNAVPGNYTLELSSKSKKVNGYSQSIKRYVKDVSVPALPETKTGWKMYPRKKITLSKGSGTVTGQQILGPELKEIQLTGAVVLQLKNAETEARIEKPLTRNDSNMLLEINLPENMKIINLLRPHQFKLDGLPKGDYSVRGFFKWQHYQNGQRFSGEARLLVKEGLPKTITIKSGKTVDLGVLTFNISPEEKTKLTRVLRAARKDDSVNTGLDRAPTFQP